MKKIPHTHTHHTITSNLDPDLSPFSKTRATHAHYYNLIITQYVTTTSKRKTKNKKPTISIIMTTTTTYTSPHPTPVRLGVIGGSGVYKLSCLQDPHYYTIATPFGNPSGPICVANIVSVESPAESVACAFLPRHGEHHSHNPSEVNYRANIYALKLLGVEFVVAINAVGSLHPDYVPGDLVLVDQLIDKTVRRESTFFSGMGVVAHVDFAFPTSDALSKVAFQAICETFPAARRSAGEGKKALGDHINIASSRKTIDDAAAATVDANFTVHASGTLCVMEGPQFSTRAESLGNKHALNGHLIGMTTCPEAKLAREAEMVFACVAMVTDTDAWQHEVAHVDVASVLRVVKANGVKAQLYPPAILLKVAEKLGLVSAGSGHTTTEDDERDGAALTADPARDAMRWAVMTHAEFIPAAAKEMMGPILGDKYPMFKQ